MSLESSRGRTPPDDAAFDFLPITRSRTFLCWKKSFGEVWCVFGEIRVSLLRSKVELSERLAAWAFVLSRGVQLYNQ